MGQRAFKDQMYAQFARLGRALASPGRLELLDLLAQGGLRQVREHRMAAGSRVGRMNRVVPVG
jgi:hypothetical protein